MSRVEKAMPNKLERLEFKHMRISRKPVFAGHKKYIETKDVDPGKEMLSGLNVCTAAFSRGNLP